MDTIVRNNLWKAICTLAEDIKSKTGLQLVSLDDATKNTLFETYEEYRSNLKSKFLGSKTIRIDRHKIAACVLMSIVKTSFFQNINKKAKNKTYLYFLCNETLGIFAGLYVLQSYMTCEQSLLDEQLKNLVNKYGIILPENDGDAYILWLASVVSNLNGSDKNVDIDIMLLANIFFMIEQYTIESYKNRLLKKETKHNLKNPR